MVKILYIMGTEASGKTTVGVGLALFLKKKGIKLGYLKPIGSSHWPTQNEDEDAILLKEVLGLTCSLDSVSPLNVGPLYLSSTRSREQYRESFLKAMEEMRCQDLDLLLVGGAKNPYILSSQEMDDVSLARELNASALFIANVNNDYALDRAILFNRYLKSQGVEVLGTIFNNVPTPILEKARGIHKPIMERQDHPVIGVIPASPELTSPTVKEYLDVLGGELLVGEEYLDRRVDDIVVGTMTIEGALKYLRRSPNKAVIVGGDRSDMALTALETSTSVLVLTGGLYPNVKVLSQAEEKKVPVILVHFDTYHTIEQLHTVSHRIKPNNEVALDLAQKNIERYCELTPLWSLLGMSGV